MARQSIKWNAFDILCKRSTLRRLTRRVKSLFRFCVRRPKTPGRCILSFSLRIPHGRRTRLCQKASFTWLPLSKDCRLEAARCAASTRKPLRSSGCMSTGSIVEKASGRRFLLTWCERQRVWPTGAWSWRPGSSNPRPWPSMNLLAFVAFQLLEITGPTRQASAMSSSLAGTSMSHDPFDPFHSFNPSHPYHRTSSPNRKSQIGNQKSAVRLMCACLENGPQAS